MTNSIPIITNNTNPDLAKSDKRLAHVNALFHDMG